MRSLWAIALAALVLAPPAEAAPAIGHGFLEIVDVLTVGVGSSSGALFTLMMDGADESVLSAGERALLQDALDDPIGLLELPNVPHDLIGRIAVRQIGPIVGAHAVDVPRDVAVAVAALGDGPVHADDLRPLVSRASVRNGDDPQLQAEDLAALLGEGGSPWPR